MRGRCYGNKWEKIIKSKIKYAIILISLALLLIIANNSSLAAEVGGDAAGSSSAGSLGSSASPGNSSSESSDLKSPGNSSDAAQGRSSLSSSVDGSASNGSINQSENAGFSGPYNIHVYVSNKDDDSLDVSLFIDSELKDTKSISSDSESKYDSYPLPAGPHNFKITWWDEDIKKSCEAEETVDVRGESSVNLYTTANDEPEEYDLSVTLTNENSKDLDAYLYVDGNFEKNKEVSKEDTTDFGTISLEEGAHNLSVRWRDADTKIEYEKKKKITLSKDDAVVFYVPAGISFDAKESSRADEGTMSDASSPGTYSGSSSSSYEKSTAYTKADDETSSGSTSLTSDNSSASSSAGGSDGANESANGSAQSSSSDTSGTSESNSDSYGSGDAYSGSSDSPGSSDSSGSYISTASTAPSGSTASSGSSAKTGPRRIGALSSSVMQSSNSLYVYAGIVILAIYLIFRH